MEAPERIEVHEGERLALSWSDGVGGVLTAGELRRACPCAGCKERPGAGRNLPAGTDPVRISGAHLVGGYAINLAFTPDGHAAGIYSYEYLRELIETA